MHARDSDLAELLGRDDELARIGAALDRAKSGRLALLRIEGEPGIGKSSLLRDAQSLAEKSGMHVVAAGCDEFDAARSFGPLADALGCTSSSDDPRRKAVAGELFKESARPDSTRAPGAAAYRLTETMGDILEEIAGATPTLVSIDDLQWADAGTTYALSSFTKRLAGLPVCLATALRSLPRTEALSQLLDLWRDDETGIEVGPLSADHVAALLARRSARPPGPGLTRFLEGAGGNPLFINELLDVLEREGSLDVEEVSTESLRAALPPDLRLTLLRRIAYLSEDAIDLLRIAAVLGRSFSLSDLCQISRRGVVEVIPLVSEWMKGGVLREAADALVFRHDLIREALYQDTPRPVRKALHLEVARVLAANGAPASRIAEHFSIGAAPGDRDAIKALRKAADTPSCPPVTRAELLNRALDLLPNDSLEARDVEIELAETLTWAGRPTEALEIAEKFLGMSSEPALRKEGRLTATRALWLLGHRNELADRVTGWLEEGTTDEAEKALLLAYGTLNLGHQAHRSLHDARDALEIAERLDDDEIRTLALLALQFANQSALKPDASRYGIRAAEIAVRNPDPEVQRLRPHTYVTVALTAECRFERAEEILREGERLRARSGISWDLPLSLTFAAVLHDFGGKWDRAVAEAEASLEAAEELQTPLWSAVARTILGRIAAYRGEFEAVQKHLRVITELTDKGLVGGSTHGHEIRLFQSRGEINAALLKIRESFQSVGDGHSIALVEFLPAVLRAGDVSLAREMVKACALALPTSHPQFCFVDAGSALIEGNRATLEDNAERCRATGMWGAVFVAQQAGVLAAREGDVDAAMVRFREVQARLEELEATWLLQLLHADMRAVGLRPGRHFSRRTAKTGWEALTEAESRVAELAAQGLTNPQIGERLVVSRRTVQSHMSHILAKLGLTSRVELATEVARRNQGSD